MRCSPLHLVAVAAVLLLPGCWPGAPIAAGILASGGSSSSSKATLAGTIIVGGATEVTSQSEREHEPNDSAGFAQALGDWGSRGPAVLTAQSGRTLRLVGLHDDGGQPRLLEDDVLLRGFERTHAVRGGGTPFAPQFVAAGDEGVWLAGPMDDGLRIRHQKSPQGLARYDVVVDVNGDVAGFTAAWDLLFVLHTDGLGTHLTAFDAMTATLVASLDLGLTRYAHLAGDTAWDGSTPRLYTVGSNDVAYEIAFDRTDAELTLSGLVPRVDLGRFGAVTGLATAGDLLFASRASDGHIGVFDPALDQRITTLPALGDDVTFGLAAHLSHGADCYALALPPGSDVTVTLEVPDTTTFTLTAFDRRAALLGDEEALIAHVETDEATTLRLVHPGGGLPWNVDLEVAATRGSGSYALQAGDGAQVTVRSDADSRGNAVYGLVSEFLDQRADDMPSDDVARARYTDWTLHEHVPGSVVLAFDERASSQATPTRVGDFELEEMRRTPTCRVASFRAAPGFDVEMPVTLGGVDIPGHVRRESSRQLQCLLHDFEGASGLRWCEPEFIARAQAETPNDPLWDAQIWQHEAINLPDAWEMTTGDDDVIIAVVDSGVRTENRDLAANLTDTGYDFVSSSLNAGDGDGIDSDPYDEGDFVSHGTHVAGSAAARGDNNFGVAGVMWRAQVIPVRALGTDGGGSTVDIAEAIRYSAGLSNASGMRPAQSAHVINLSLGSASPSNAMRDAVSAAKNAGAVVLAAAGNDGIEGVLYPAAYEDAICIAATNILNDRASYSNMGPEVDLAVPGGDGALSGDPDNDIDDDGNIDRILSTVGDPNEVDGLFAYLIGTSMACGNAAGIAGLLLAGDSTLTPDQLQNLLESTALDLGDSGDDVEFGAGLVQVDVALANALPVLSVNVETLDFGQNGSSLLAQYGNDGSGTLAIEGVALSPLMGDNADWLTATMLPDGQTIGLEADRTGLADGVYQVRVRVRSNGGNSDVVVSLTQAANAELPDVGVVVVRLLDSDGNVVSSTQTTVGKVYNYRLQDVPFGEFFVQAAIDEDSDGIFCEAGEACGMYPSRDAPSLLNFGDLRSLDLDLFLEE